MLLNCWGGKRAVPQLLLKHTGSYREGRQSHHESQDMLHSSTAGLTREQYEMISLLTNAEPGVSVSHEQNQKPLFCRALQLSYNSTAKTKKEKENVFICIVNTVTKIIEC